MGNLASNSSAENTCMPYAPVSEQFSARIVDAWSYGGVVFLFLPVALTTATMVLYMEEIHYVMRKSNSKPLRNALLWILGAHSSIMLIATVGIFVPRAVVEVGFMYNIYEAYAVYKHYYLIIVFAGGTKPFVEKSSAKEVRPNVIPCPCLVCLPSMKNSRRITESVKWIIFQYVVITPFTGAVAVIMRADGMFYKVNGVSPSVYLAIINAISTLICMYGMKLLYRFTQNIDGMEETHAVKGKTMCMQLTMFVVGFESLIFNVIGELDIIPCTYPFNFQSKRRVFYNYSVVPQMFFIGLLTRYFYRRVKDVQRQVILHDDLSLAVDYTGESCLRADATLHRARECDNIFIGRKMSYHGMDSIPAPMNLIPTQDQDDSSNSPQVSISDKELIMGDQDTNDTTRQIATPTVREIKLQHADTMASDSQV